MNPNWYVGIWDRLVILPGVVAFIETKRPSISHLRATQIPWLRFFKRTETEHAVLNTKRKVDIWLEEKGFSDD